MKNTELEQLINDKLNSAAISDYAPNGLQVEGKETVHKIVTGVTASQALLDEAGTCRWMLTRNWVITRSWQRCWGSPSWVKSSRWCHGENSPCRFRGWSWHRGLKRV